MNIRRFLIAAAVASMAASAYGALSPEYEAWRRSAVHFLFTEEEETAWKAVKTDADARAFVDLFWARRDPTPATPKNEYREVIEERIRYADQNFNTDRKKTAGSLTDRGMMLLLFGQPTKAGFRHVSELEEPRGGFSRPSDQRSHHLWIYEGDAARTMFGVPRADFRFVDVGRNEEFILERAPQVVDIPNSRKKAITATVTQPDLKKAPEFTSVPMTGSVVAPPAAPGVSAALTTPALAAAVADLKAAAKNPLDGTAFVSWAELVTPAGETFVPLSLYIPKSSPAATAQNATFFGVIEDESGKAVAAFEAPAALTATKEDFFVDRTLRALPAGKYRAHLGLASDGKPVAFARTDLQLAGPLDKSAAAISGLILSNNVYGLDKPQGPTDPFAFGGMKVVPKSDKVFRASSDELWYFFELRNPGMAEAIAPTEGTVTGAPPEQLPKIQIKVDITGKAADGTSVKKSAPMADAQAMALRGVPGHFAVGSAIPLTSFKPGDYTVAIKVIDVVTKATYTISDTFRVVQ